METIKYKGLEIRIWEKSFSVNNCKPLWLGNDNRLDVIKDLIDRIYSKAQDDIRQELRKTLGI